MLEWQGFPRWEVVDTVREQTNILDEFLRFSFARNDEQQGTFRSNQRPCCYDGANRRRYHDPPRYRKIQRRTPPIDERGQGCRHRPQVRETPVACVCDACNPELLS
jgi:hypothetical protein